MTIKRLMSLQVILLGGLGSVFLLPKDIRMQPTSIDLALPEFVGSWQGKDSAITQGERDILGADTQFSRKVYSRGTDEIFVSIVLSGPDMNTSIHRPERCLPAQGWTISNSEKANIQAGERNLSATRLHNLRSVQLTDGQSRTVRSLNYYWFVGHSDVTASHYERTWIDIRDRVLKGRNQQWAYVTVASTITKDFKVFGRDEHQADGLMREFIRDFVPLVQRASTVAGN